MDRAAHVGKRQVSSRQEEGSRAGRSPVYKHLEIGQSERGIGKGQWGKWNESCESTGTVEMSISLFLFFFFFFLHLLQKQLYHGKGIRNRVYMYISCTLL